MSDFQSAFVTAGNLMLAFPEPLTEKYRPKKISDFVGIDKPKRVCAALVRQPIALNLYFQGASGTGKTTLALALASEMPAELHHIASKECTLETVKEIVRQCHYMPRMFSDWQPCKMHVVLIDEADQMSYAAQLAFLSVLDGTGRPPNTRALILSGYSQLPERRAKMMAWGPCPVIADRIQM
jgi:replication-associated recombination protein RarA